VSTASNNEHIPPPLPDEGGTLGGIALILALIFAVSSIGLPVMRIPAGLLLATILSPVSLVLGSGLGIAATFSRSRRNQRLGMVSLGLIWSLSGLLFAGFLLLQ